MTRPPSPPSSSSSPSSSTEPTTSMSSRSGGDSSNSSNSRSATLTSGIPRHALLPHHHTQNKGREGGRAFASPRLCSGPLFAVPSVSLNNTHAVSSSIGPLTPPLTLDHQQATHNTTIINPFSPPPSLPTPTPTNGSSAKLRMAVIGQNAHHPKEQHHSIQQRQQLFSSANVVHDVHRYMFRIKLNSKGSIAALCYLPMRFQRMIEFYHTEIPTAYRDLGLGDLLVAEAFRWAEATKLLVIPTCLFVQRYLDRNSTNWGCVVHTESEGLARLFAASSSSSSSSSSLAAPPPPPLHHQSPPTPVSAPLQHEESGAIE